VCPRSVSPRSVSPSAVAPAGGGASAVTGAP